MEERGVDKVVGPVELKRLFDQYFPEEDYRTVYVRDENRYRVELLSNGKGVNIDLAKVLAKFEREGQSAIDNLITHIKKSLAMTQTTHLLDGNQTAIFPVIRAKSFPDKTKEGKVLMTISHTAETVIYFALDLGDAYVLIDEVMLQESSLDQERVVEMAYQNLSGIPIETRHQQVSGNDFYFVTNNDGYDASRILNTTWLNNFTKDMNGEVVLAVPHQDSFIIADIHNAEGYDILQQMAMQFFAEGRIPITALSFVYEEEKLEPIFILAKKKPRDTN